jgi:hypothetical protein
MGKLFGCFIFYYFVKFVACELNYSLSVEYNKNAEIELYLFDEINANFTINIGSNKINNNLIKLNNKAGKIKRISFAVGEEQMGDNCNSFTKNNANVIKCHISLL